MTFEELKKALTTLDIPEKATLKEIKERHRSLVKLFHPDTGEERDPGKIRRINEAYATLTDYCRNYRFSFSEEEFYEQNLEERLRMQFGQEPF